MIDSKAGKESLRVMKIFCGMSKTSITMC